MRFRVAYSTPSSGQAGHGRVKASEMHVSNLPSNLSSSTTTIPSSYEDVTGPKLPSQLYESRTCIKEQRVQASTALRRQTPSRHSDIQLAYLYSRRAGTRVQKAILDPCGGPS